MCIKRICWLVILCSHVLCMVAEATELQNLNCFPIEKKADKQLKHFALPLDHPMQFAMEELFHEGQSLTDEIAFETAGFITHHIQPRSYIRVASHASLPGFLVKVCLDSELRLKEAKADWVWFIRRCETAEHIRKIIKDKNLQYFEVPQKYLYEVRNTSKRKAHKVVLLVEDMHILSASDNKAAWLSRITYEHLNELYIILSRSPGITVRADNIVFTANNKLAFIDTEYRDLQPRYSELIPNLSDEMQAYWRSLVKRGGA